MGKLADRLISILDEIFPEKFTEKDVKENSFFIWKKAQFTYFLKPVKNPFLIEFDDLMGIDAIKKDVYRNTLQFLKGFKANNVLLWGEKGCGKSSLIKSLIPIFKTYDLKLIEVNNEDFNSLEELFEIIVKLPFKFIIFLDDISFGDNDKNFKKLKAILDGNLVETSDNYIIYATSNRRHLVKETFSTEQEIHTSDAVSEKISLSDRFGIAWGFYKPDQETYLQIIKHYVKKFNLEIFSNNKEAVQFAMQKGGFSGRTAYQYAVSLFKNKI